MVRSLTEIPKVPRRRATAGGLRDAGFNGATPYTAADSAIDTLAGFLPENRAIDAEILPGRDRVSARARDLVRNNGWATGAIAKEVDSVIGANFRPLLKPDWRALGLSAEWARAFKEAVEARWRSYADDPRKLADTTRSQTVSQMFGTAYRTYLVDGEALALLNWRRFRPTKTTLRLVDPDLLTNPNGGADTAGLRGGVEISRDGAARAYHFRQGHPATTWANYADAFRWKRIAREGRNGRPQVLHFFDKVRDGQTRGISRLAPIVEKLKMEDHYSRVELQAAVINAVLAAFIKSPMGPEVIDELFGEGDGQAFLGYQAARSEYYRDRPGMKIGGARVQTLYPNDEIGMVNTARPAAQFADFESAVLRHIASGLGVSYEQLASDWSKTNYSSARAAMIEIWRGFAARRTTFAQGFCQPFFMAWLEEQVMDGHIPLPSGAPDFYAFWPAYARTKWIGPGKGFVDPVKEAQAAAMRVALGLSTLEEEAAELTGTDYADNMEQIRSEIDAMPEGTLHPMQESFAKLLGPAVGYPSDHDRQAYED
ncbi:phage portal protein [Roseivivax isoporae]|uniref:Capsid protein n=1 Tax=Roseivivax isoporae LMG 25204 TaxID=1449351 RepID=X7F247_9RHOB|nr:phage portal protein [Roseivivax isoporae]ETX26860.1 capsid protein [Roseivivax isoporae LMG 25204]